MQTESAVGGDVEASLPVALAGDDEEVDMNGDRMMLAICHDSAGTFYGAIPANRNTFCPETGSFYGNET
jgi:hypothetical protein